MTKEAFPALLEGRKAVMEAIDNNRPIDKLFIKKDAAEGTLKVIIAKARQKGIVISEVSPRKLEELSQSRNHQGVVAVTPAREYCEISDILELAKKKNEPPFVLVLDGITDTYNMGAIIRTANACGVHGVIIPKHRSATLTGMVAKASAGAIEYVSVARVANITAAVEELKNNGLWVYCASAGAKSVFDEKISGAVALVIGEEGKGVSRLVAEKCDITVGIPMFGVVPSLNASVAAGVLMYEIVKNRIQAKGEG